MRLLALLLLIGTAHAQGLTTLAPGATGGGKVLASFPLTTSGPLITEDANVVSHVWFNGTALVDTKGNAWTQNGTVPQTSNFWGTVTGRGGAGPFSAANYYSLGAGSPLAFTGDFTICFVSVMPASVTEGMIYASDLTTGYYITQGANIAFVTNADAALTAASTSGAVNVFCAGRSGGTNYLKVNNGTTASGAKAYTRNAAVTPLLGRTGAGYPFLGTIYEVWASSTPFTESQVVGIMQKVLGHYDGSAPLAVTRATNATYEKSGTIWTVPAGVARITTDGLLVEPARTNYALQSDSMSTGTAATSPWALSNATVATVAGAPIGTWAEVTSSTNVGQILIAGATVASATQFVVSAWTGAATGTGTSSILTGGTSVPSACSCVRSDGGTCTAGVFSTNYCSGVFPSIGTTPVRISVMGTWAARTSIDIRYYPGEIGVSTGTMRFAAADLQVGTYPTSHISVGGTSVLRASDQVSATVPAAPAKFSVAGTFKKGNGAPWTSGTSWSLGTAAGANSASLTMGAANLVFTLIDGSTASKTCTVTAPGYAAGSSNALTAKGLAGTLSLTGGCTQAGAGSGQFGTVPTTLYLGQTSAGDQFSGFIKSLTLNKVTK